MIDVEDQIRTYAQAITAGTSTATPSTDAGMPTYGSPHEPLDSSGRGRYLVAAAVVVALLVSGVVIVRGEESERPTLASTTTTEPDDRIEAATTTSSTIDPAGLAMTTEPTLAPSTEGSPAPLLSLDNDVLLSSPVVPFAPPLATGLLEIQLEFPHTSWVAGSWVGVRILIWNYTGAPIETKYCRAPFAVGLESDTIPLQAFDPGCAFIYEQEEPWWPPVYIPVGVSEWNVQLRTSYLMCKEDGLAPPFPGAPPCPPEGDPMPPLPPGTYRTGIWVDFPTGGAILPEPITFTVL